MSIWSGSWEMKAYDADYQPKSLTAEVTISEAPSWNDCIRLDVAEDPQWRTSASAMLTRAQARELAAALNEWAASEPGKRWRHTAD